jgi:hypothetical protein
VEKQKEMDFAMQQEVWAKLPLNDFQRRDMLSNLIQEMTTMDESSGDTKSALEETPQKKRKRAPPNEQCENLHRMC